MRGSAAGVHFVVVAEVVAGGDGVEPFGVVEVPADGFLYPFLELQRGFPSELALELAGVDGVAHVVALAVGDVGDEAVGVAFGVSEQAVDGADYYPYQVDVLPFVEASDVVGLGGGATVEYEVDGAGVVLDIEPVAHVIAASVDGKRAPMADVVDEEGDEFFGELVGAVVVGAAGNGYGEAVGVVVGAYEVVARGFGG